MTTNTLKTLFHPFEAGDLDPPGAGARVLFLGAPRGLVLPDGFAAEPFLVQGFRPDFLALERAGFAVAPQSDGQDYDVALILMTRHRGQNELRLAEALERTRGGALVLLAGSKEDGAASLKKRVEGLLPIAGQAPKYHGQAFWLHRPDDAAAAIEALRAANPEMPVEGRFATAPGMFSHARVDPGSLLLAENLPRDLGGHVADFCAGWGYLAAQAWDRNAHLKSLDLYEADFASLEAARRNLKTVSATKFFWRDLASEPVRRRYDFILMNPPFHEGRAAEPDLGARLVEAAARGLEPGGRLLMVANRGLPYEQVLARNFRRFEEAARDARYKLLFATR